MIAGKEYPFCAIQVKIGHFTKKVSAEAIDGTPFPCYNTDSADIPLKFL